jgi:hypothetical protein
MFVENVFDEFHDKEAVVACNKRGSKVLELLLRELPLDKVLRFISALKPR